MSELSKLLGEEANSLKYIQSKKNSVDSISNALMVKKADIKILKIQMLMVKKPGAVASLNAWKDLQAEVEYYELQSKKLEQDLSSNKAEIQTHQKILQQLQNQIAKIQKTIRSFGQVIDFNGEK